MTWKCTNTPKGDNKLYSDAKGVVPSLDLRFAEGKTLNDYMTGTPLVDHQRSMSGSNLSPGTFVNSSGLVESAKVNLLTYSEDYSQWSTAFGGTLTLETSFNPPSGLRTVYKLEGDGTKASAEAPNNVNTQDQYTVTVYANAGTAQYIQIWKSGGVGNLTANFDLINGTSNAVADCATDITPAGNGWYRCQVVSDSSIDQFKPLRIHIAESLSAGRNAGYTGSGYVYLSGAQIETGTTASTYIPTTNAASAAPRFDHDPTTGESLGLLIEESRTNVQWFDPLSSVLSSASVDGPTGNSANVYERAATNETAAITVQTNWTQDNGMVLSFFVKKQGNGRYFKVHPQGQLFGNAKWTYDYDTKTIVENNLFSFSVDELPNGWHRIKVVSSPVVRTSAHILGISVHSALPTSGTNLDTGLLYGIQLEEGAFPTSYIPTTGTALTRSTDVASITGSNFSSWYNQSEGTLYADASVFSNPTDIVMIGTNNFFNPQSWGIYAPTGDTYGYIRTSSAYQFIGGPTRSNDKSALAFNGTTVSTTCSGETPVTGSIANPPTGVNGLYLSSGVTGVLNKTVSRLTYFPERLPDSSLQTMTTP